MNVGVLVAAVAVGVLMHVVTLAYLDRGSRERPARPARRVRRSARSGRVPLAIGGAAALALASATGHWALQAPYSVFVNGVGVVGLAGSIASTAAGTAISALGPVSFV